jgi:hypothetical protein
VHTVWREGGIDALRRLCEEDPAAFVSAAGKLVPRDFDLGTETASGLPGVLEALGKLSRGQ